MRLQAKSPCGHRLVRARSGFEIFNSAVKSFVGQ